MIVIHCACYVQPLEFNEKSYSRVYDSKKFKELKNPIPAFRVTVHSTGKLSKQVAVKQQLMLNLVEINFK